MVVYFLHYIILPTVTIFPMIWKHVWCTRYSTTFNAVWWIKIFSRVCVHFSGLARWYRIAFVFHNVSVYGPVTFLTIVHRWQAGIVWSWANLILHFIFYFLFSNTEYSITILLLVVKKLTLYLVYKYHWLFIF